MENLTIYEHVRQVPESAKRSIQAGRLKGKTDINPMWRLKALTEQFGPCGIGWKYVITDKRLEQGANNEVAAFLDIDLYIKVDGAWSEAIPGTGGSTFVASERNGLYTSDECFKMALTDAISVACKALGFGADVYWDKDTTKYGGTQQAAIPAEPIMCQRCGRTVQAAIKRDGSTWAAADMAAYSKRRFKKVMCAECMKLAQAEEAAVNGAG